MRALITNDDGIDSPGLAVLARAAVAAGLEVIVAAPAREASGASASLTGAEEDGRLLIEEHPGVDLPRGVQSFAVGAAPGLIAFLAAHEGFGAKPDIVLSGVNRGANIGHAVLHSGTVGAALSAHTFRIPALAVSLASSKPRHWSTAERITAHGLAWLLENMQVDGVLSINVPDVPIDEVRGVRKAPLASFGAVQARVKHVEGGAHEVTYAEIDPTQDADSDAGLLARGWATLTLLRAPCWDENARLPEYRDGPPPA
jgi:5'-nucleotidase